MWKTLASIFSSLAQGGGEAPLWVESFWFYEPIKLPNKIRTPMGSNVSVIEVCADIKYAIREGKPVILQVRLSKKGQPGPAGGPCNMCASNKGEVWYATGITPNTILVEVVEKELACESSHLRRIMFGKWADLRPASGGGAVADALNKRVDADQLDGLIKKAERRCRIQFIYDTPKRGRESRVVIVRRANGATIIATDTKDDVDKSFRLDRITDARQA